MPNWTPLANMPPTYYCWTCDTMTTKTYLQRRLDRLESERKRERAGRVHITYCVVGEAEALGKDCDHVIIIGGTGQGMPRPRDDHRGHGGEP